MQMSASQSRQLMRTAAGQGSTRHKMATHVEHHSSARDMQNFAPLFKAALNLCSLPSLGGDSPGRKVEPVQVAQFCNSAEASFQSGKTLHNGPLEPWQPSGGCLDQESV